MGTDLKTIQTLTKFAKRNKIEKLKFADKFFTIEIEFSAAGLMTTSEKKQIEKLISAPPKSEEERRKEYESDLFYSAQ